MKLQKSIDEMILQGKDFEQCEYEIISTWEVSQHQKGYEILDKYLLDGKFNINRKEAKKLRPELFITVR